MQVNTQGEKISVSFLISLETHSVEDFIYLLYIRYYLISESFADHFSLLAHADKNVFVTDFCLIWMKKNYLFIPVIAP